MEAPLVVVCVIHRSDKTGESCVWFKDVFLSRMVVDCNVRCVHT